MIGATELELDQGSIERLNQASAYTEAAGANDKL
jgi:hypothetical protein